MVWCETGSLWKRIIARLETLVRKLKRKQELFQQYRKTIKEQEEQVNTEKVAHGTRRKRILFATQVHDRRVH